MWRGQGGDDDGGDLYGVIAAPAVNSSIRPPSNFDVKELAKESPLVRRDAIPFPFLLSPLLSPLLIRSPSCLAQGSSE